MRRSDCALAQSDLSICGSGIDNTIVITAQSKFKLVSVDEQTSSSPASYQASKTGFLVTRFTNSCVHKTEILKS